MNLVTQLRRIHFDEFVNVKNLSGLEIGPYNQPLITKLEGNIEYLDFLTQEDLLKLNGPDDLQFSIPQTDYVVNDNHYSNYVKKQFDYIIANHVGEHVPNFIDFFCELEKLLKPGGILFIALPDKKFTFDKYRKDTDLSHFLYDYYQNIDEISKEHLLEVEIYYDLEFVGGKMDLKERLSNSRLLKEINKKTNIGTHCHVFTSEKVLSKVIYPLIFMQLIRFKLLKFVPALAEHGGEMIAIFKKESENNIAFEAKDFYSL